MGMYTELYLSCEFKPELPDGVKSILLYLFADGDKPDSLPEHEFFKCTRWNHVGSACSYYFIPFYVSHLVKPQDCYYLTTRSDLKNYDGEIKKFLDWIIPHIADYEPSHIGHFRKEHDDHPTVIILDEGEVRFVTPK